MFCINSGSRAYQDSNEIKNHNIIITVSLSRCLSTARSPWVWKSKILDTRRFRELVAAARCRTGKLSTWPQLPQAVTAGPQLATGEETKSYKREACLGIMSLVPYTTTGKKGSKNQSHLDVWSKDRGGLEMGCELVLKSGWRRWRLYCTDHATLQSTDNASKLILPWSQWQCWGVSVITRAHARTCGHYSHIHNMLPQYRYVLFTAEPPPISA